MATAVVGPDIDHDPKNGVKKTKVFRAQSTFSSLKEGTKLLFVDFLETTTLHGIQYVSNKKHSPLRRTIWACLMLTCTTVLGYSASIHVKTYHAHGTKEEIRSTQKTLADFPAVTICNYNFVKKSLIEKNMTSDIMSAIVAMEGVFLASAMEGVRVDDALRSLNLTDFILTNAPNSSDMIMDCKWNKDPNACGYANFTQRLTDTGLCYTFNDGPFHKVNADDLGNDTRRLQVGEIGTRAGLWLRLNAQVDDHLDTEWDDGVGFKILLHRPGDVPLVGDIGQAIMPGVRTLFAIQKKVIKSMPAPFDTDCRKEPLALFPFYSHNACLMECDTKAIVHRCGCRFPYMPGTEPYCNLGEYLNCLNDYLPWAGEKEMCSCKKPCYEEIFTMTTSYLKAPRKAVAKQLMRRFNWTQEDVSNNIAEVEIFFDSMNELSINVVDAFGLADLASSLGGSCGLFLGASVLTIFEFLDYFVVGNLHELRFVRLLWRKLRGRKRRVDRDCRRDEPNPVVLEFYTAGRKRSSVRFSRVPHDFE